MQQANAEPNCKTQTHIDLHVMRCPSRQGSETASSIDDGRQSAKAVAGLDVS